MFSVLKLEISPWIIPGREFVTDTSLVFPVVLFFFLCPSGVHCPSSDFLCRTIRWCVQYTIGPFPGVHYVVVLFINMWTIWSWTAWTLHVLYYSQRFSIIFSTVPTRQLPVCAKLPANSPNRISHHYHVRSRLMNSFFKNTCDVFTLTVSEVFISSVNLINFIQSFTPFSVSLNLK